MCKNAGITGYRTNHSLRATTATRLHQSDSVEEQEIIGHRSIEAVRSYKRSSHEQLEQVSDILNNGNSKKRICYDDTVLEIDADNNMSTSTVSRSLSLEYNRSGAAPVFNFSSCASVVINNYPQK